MAELEIRGIWPGQEIEIKKVQAYKVMDKVHLIGITEAGYVYTLGICSAQTTDLIDGWRANDALRRAWCKLTGHKMSEIRTEQKKRKEEDAKVKRVRDEKRMRNTAERLGFKVVRMKAK